MNAEDALRAMEEREISENIAASMRARLATQEASLAVQATEELRRRNQVIREQNIQLSEAHALIRKRNADVHKAHQLLNKLQHDRNFTATISLSSTLILDQIIRDFAKFAGISEADLRRSYNVLQTQLLNRLVNEGMSRDRFNVDPRGDMPQDVKEWYVSGLDADNGF